MSVWIPWIGKGLVLIMLLIGASWCDIRSRKVPDIYSILILSAALFTPDTGKWWGIFCALPFFIAALTIGGIGGADIKITGAAGMMLGFPEGMSAVVLGLMSMLFFHAVKKLLCRRPEEEQPGSYPLVPFLAAGITFVYLAHMPG